MRVAVRAGGDAGWVHKSDLGMRHGPSPGLLGGGAEASGKGRIEDLVATRGDAMTAARSAVAHVLLKGAEPVPMISLTRWSSSGRMKAQKSLLVCL